MCVRGLFSDDVLTFRNRDALLAEFQKPNPSAAVVGRVLSKKAPHLRQLTCERVTFHILQFFRQRKEQFSLSPSRATDGKGTFSLKDLKRFVSDELDQDPFALLVRISLLAAFSASLGYPDISHDDLINDDKGKDLLLGQTHVTDVTDESDMGPEPDHCTLQSFPEFCQNLSGSVRMHPTVRLVKWIMYVQHTVFPDPTMPLEEAQVQDVLQRLVLIDQPGFPLVTNVTVHKPSLDKCRAFAEDGDYMDMVWIKSCIQRNIAISWEMAGKAWQSNYLSNLAELNSLLEICPDRQSCLNAVSPANLCSLMSTYAGTKEFGNLSRFVVEYLDTKTLRESYENGANPLLQCIWIEYIWQHSEHDKTEAPHVVSSKLENRDGLLTSTFLWASRFGTDQIRPPATGREILNDRIVRDVKRVVQDILEHHAERKQEMLLALFRGAFAPLAPTPISTSLSQDNVDVVFSLASALICETWPEELSKLARLFHGHVKAPEELAVFTSWPVFARDGSTVTLPADSEAQLQLASHLLARTRDGVLPCAWQIAFLTQLATPWDADALGMVQDPAYVLRTFESGLQELRRTSAIKICTVGNANQKHPINEQMKAWYRQIHILDDLDRLGKFNATSIMRALADKEQRAKTRGKMQLLGKVFTHLKSSKNTDEERETHEQILRFYNDYIGQECTKQQIAQGEPEYDEYKNPKGDNFDLARKGAFCDLPVVLLVGNFSDDVCFELVECPSAAQVTRITISCNDKNLLWRRHSERKVWVETSETARALVARVVQDAGDNARRKTCWLPELESHVLEQNIRTRLQDKGFKVDIVTKEEQFSEQLSRAHVAWVISGSSDCFLRRRGYNVDDAQRVMLTFTAACVAFNARGNGLLLFGENTPLFFHANAILRCFDQDAELCGDNPGDKFVVYDKSQPQSISDVVAQRLSAHGKFENMQHPILTGILTMYEGITVAKLARQSPTHWEGIVSGGVQDLEVPPWLVFAHKRKHTSTHGRILVDTGYTKLWNNWTAGATDRYVCNASAWLTGVDLRIARATSLDQTHTSALFKQDEHLRSSPLPISVTDYIDRKLEDAIPPGVDMVLVIDLSGSMSSYMREAATFTKTIADTLLNAGGNNRVGVVKFGCNASICANLGSSYTTIVAAADNYACMGGTNYQNALAEVVKIFDSTPPIRHQKRMMLFQTDGYDGGNDRSKQQYMLELVSPRFNVKCCAVVVSSDPGTIDGAVKVTGEHGRIGDRSLVKQMTSYGDLVREAENIVGQFHRAA